MALFNKQQSAPFLEAMVKHSTACFKSRYAMLYFIHHSPNRALVKHIEIEPERHETFLDDYTALLIYQLLQNAPNVQSVRLTMDGFVRRPRLFPDMESGSPLLHDLATLIFTKGYRLMRSQSADFFWAMATKLRFFDPAQKLNVELQCALEFFSGERRQLGLAVLSFKNMMLRVTIEGREIAIPQNYLVCPAPVDHLHGLLDTAGKVENKVSTLVQQVTGQSVTIPGRLELLEFLARSHGESESTLLCYGFFNATGVSVGGLNRNEANLDHWHYGEYDRPGGIRGYRQSFLGPTERKKLLQHLKSSMPTKPKLQSREDAFALIAELLGAGGVRVSDFDEALIEAYLAKNGFDWGRYPMSWVKKVVEFVRGGHWYLEQECKAFCECYG